MTRFATAAVLVSAAVAAAPIAIAQSGSANVRARVSDVRPLTAVEVSTVVAAAQRTLVGHPFRLTLGLGAGPEFLIDAEGHIRFRRTVTNGAETLVEYTSAPARYCNGTPAEGELTTEFRQAGTGWNVHAGRSTRSDVGQPILDVLAGRVPLVDRGITADGRSRILTAPWSPMPERTEEAVPGGSRITVKRIGPVVSGTQTLYVDLASLRPQRWEIAVSGSPSPPVAYLFEYDDSLVLARPAAAAAPDCIGSP